MEYKNIPSMVCMLFIFCCILRTIFGQTTENTDMQKLQGRWELEVGSCEALLHNSKGVLHVGFDSVSTVNVFQAIEIKQNVVTFLSFEGETKNIQYMVKDNYLSFDMPSGKFVVEWILFDNKLYLEYSMPVSVNEIDKFGEPGKIVVLSAYKRG